MPMVWSIGMFLIAGITKIVLRKYHRPIFNLISLVTFASAIYFLIYYALSR